MTFSNARKYQYLGHRLTLREWADALKMDATTLRSRIDHGWPDWLVFWPRPLRQGVAAIETKPDGREG